MFKSGPGELGLTWAARHFQKEKNLNEITPENTDSQSVSPDIPAIQSYWEDGPPALVEDLEELITYIRALLARIEALKRDRDMWARQCEDCADQRDAAVAILQEALARRAFLEIAIKAALAALGADAKEGR